MLQIYRFRLYKLIYKTFVAEFLKVFPDIPLTASFSNWKWRNVKYILIYFTIYLQAVLKVCAHTHTISYILLKRDPEHEKNLYYNTLPEIKVRYTVYCLYFLLTPPYRSLFIKELSSNASFIWWFHVLSPSVSTLYSYD